VCCRRKEIILGLNASPEVRAELLAVAFTIGACYLTDKVLANVFHRELPMIKGSEMIQEWIAEGEAQGEARRARAILRRLLRERYGELPKNVVRRIEQEEPDGCEEMVVRAATAPSLEEIGL